MALAVATPTAVSIPPGFFAICYVDQAYNLQRHSDFTSERLAQYAYIHGATWSYARERLGETIAQTQSSGEDLHQVARLPDGREVAHHGDLPLRPHLSRSTEILVHGGVVGTVTVSLSLLPLLLQTALVVLFALCLVGSIFFAMHRLPLRALDETLGKLQLYFEEVDLRELLDGSCRLVPKSMKPVSS